MTNPYNVLQEDPDDTSTSNVSRKLNKMIRMQEKNPTVERAKKIKELEAIVNPQKDTPKPPTKKKKKKSVKKDNIEKEKQKIRDKKFKEREKKRLEKEEEEKIQKELYEQYKSDMQKKNNKRSRNKMLTEEKADELIDKFTDTDLIKEFRKNNFRGIKYHALLMLSYKGIPSDIMRIIMKDLKKFIYVTPMKSLIQSDIYDYIRRKFKNTVTERKLKLHYHPDKNNNYTNQLFIFLKNIMDTKFEV